jgi:hypothetical protein
MEGQFTRMLDIDEEEFEWVIQSNKSEVNAFRLQNGITPGNISKTDSLKYLRTTLKIQQY